MIFKEKLSVYFAVELTREIAYVVYVHALICAR